MSCISNRLVSKCKLVYIDSLQKLQKGELICMFQNWNASLVNRKTNSCQNTLDAEPIDQSGDTAFYMVKF